MSLLSVATPVTNPPVLPTLPTPNLAPSTPVPTHAVPPSSSAPTPTIASGTPIQKPTTAGLHPPTGLVNTPTVSIPSSPGPSSATGQQFQPQVPGTPISGSNIRTGTTAGMRMCFFTLLAKIYTTKFYYRCYGRSIPSSTTTNSTTKPTIYNTDTSSAIYPSTWYFHLFTCIQIQISPFQKVTCIILCHSKVRTHLYTAHLRPELMAHHLLRHKQELEHLPLLLLPLILWRLQCSR